MFFRRLKLSHTRCFLPAIYFNKNIHDEMGTKDVKEKNVGGWQGVVNAFSPDEDGNPSADVRGIISTICYSTLLGGVYGSLSYSKRAYFDFFEKNQSTLFQNQFAAKSKLQTQVTLAMARGSFKWGMRVALFCGPFATLVTIINAYKQKVSIISYGIAGLFVGGFARIHMGVKGALVGSTLGGLLGILVGSLTVLILSFTPISIDDINDWQKQYQSERDAYFIKEQKQSIIFQYDKPPELVEHEKRLQTTETVTNKS